MKVTPLDIRRKEFKRGMRGYNDEEVDVFLDDVADEFERLFQENMELQDKMQRLDEQIAGHTQLKNALEKTLVSAQLQADQMIANARKEAELVLRDAELKARHIVNDSYGETQRVQQTLVQLKHLEEDFRFKFRSLLEGHLKLLNDAPITPPQPAATADTMIPPEAVLTAEAAPLVETVPIALPEEVVEVAQADPPEEVAEVTPFPEVAPLSEPAPYELPEDTLTEDTEGGEAVPGDLAAVSGAAMIDEPTAELTVETPAVQVEEEDPQPAQGYYFGKMVEPPEEDFFSSDSAAKDKTRDFEW